MLEESYKKIVGCEHLLILNAIAQNNYKGKMFDKEIIIKNIKNYLGLGGIYTNNNVSLNDGFILSIKRVVPLNVFNYMVIPLKIKGKERKITTIMVFINKVNKKKDRVLFDAFDRIIGKSVAYIHYLIYRYETINGKYRSEKKEKYEFSNKIKEILCCVNY